MNTMILGILGTGMIVQEALPVWKKFHLDKIYILSTDRSYAKACDLKQKYHLDNIFTDYDALLASDVSLIYIALPNDLHENYAAKALSCQKHVIVEKPAVLCADGWNRLLAAARHHQVKIFEAMSLHALPAYRQMLSDLEKIGRIRIVSLNYSQYSSRYDLFRSGGNPAVFDAARGGGALNDINIYNIHAVLGLSGRPVRVRYFKNTYRNVDTSGTLVMEYDDFHAVCIGAKDCNVKHASFIQGELGTIYIRDHVNGMKGYTVCLNCGQTQQYLDRREEHRLYWEFQEFMRIIREDDTAAYDRLAQLTGWAVGILEECKSSPATYRVPETFS